jgi:hypothetical protein
MPPEFYFFSAVTTIKYVCRLCYTLSTLLQAAKSLHFAEASLFKVENLKKISADGPHTLRRTLQMCLLYTVRKTYLFMKIGRQLIFLSILSFFVTMFSKGR